MFSTPQDVTVEEFLSSQFFSNDEENEIDNVDVTKEIANLKLDDVSIEYTVKDC